jgi:hypothetical protein
VTQANHFFAMLTDRSYFAVILSGVMGSIVAAAILAAFTRIRHAFLGFVLPKFQLLLNRLPRKVIPLVRHLANGIFPGWRDYAPSGKRNSNTLQRRVTKLSSVKRLPTIVVGGVYLDIILSPVSLNKDNKIEYGDLDSVEASPGGSAYFVTQHLWKEHTHETHLFSQIGCDDSFSKQLDHLLSNKPWIRMKRLPATQSQCGVAFHMRDQYGKPLPTLLSHRGANSELKWRSLKRPIRRLSWRGGGVLYLSGFFRTSLHVDFASSMRELSPELVIIVDHGRFQPGETPAAERALLEGFKSGTIDIYICTLSEIQDFVQSVNHHILPNQPVSDIDQIQSLAALDYLPRVTVIRGDLQEDVPTAYLIIDHKIHTVQYKTENWDKPDNLGGDSSFTAGFIHNLFKKNGGANLRDTMTSATKFGLQQWSTQA